MSISASKAALDRAIDDLLSVRSSGARQTAALASLEAVVARLALGQSSPLADAFLRWQDSPSRNVAAALLEWLARTLLRNDLAGDTSNHSLWADMLRCLRLLQGLLLLHRPSQRFFARKSTHENLLAVLDLARPNDPDTPLLGTPRPQPSPVLFPPTPASSPSLQSESYAETVQVELCTRLSLAVLDVLLCGLVDRPENMRTFENVGGLAAIVKVLKDKTVSQNVRIKVIEVLFFYLLPEATSSTTRTGAESPDLLLDASITATSTLESKVLAHPEQLPGIFSGAAEFIPQTPVKSNSRRHTSRSASRDGVDSSREASPARTPRNAERTAGRPSEWVLDSHVQGTAPQSNNPMRARTAVTPRRRPPVTDRQTSFQDTSPTRAGPSPTPPRPVTGHRRTQSASGARTEDDLSYEMRPPDPRPRASPSLDRSRGVVRADMPPPPRPSSIRQPLASRRTVSQPTAPQRVDHAAEASTTQQRMTSRGQPVRSRHLRTEAEKKELLRLVMPNVDALQERFKAMGLEL
ncbi:hypothetical protein JCM3774_003458 [Rhodotorula dairenensis]